MCSDWSKRRKKYRSGQILTLHRSHEPHHDSTYSVRFAFDFYAKVHAKGDNVSEQFYHLLHTEI